MALTLIYQPTIAKIDTIELDASISESHVGEVEVTEHPVEQGANISDHARPKPETLSIEGVVSNTPVSRKQVLKIQNGIGSAESNADDVRFRPEWAESAYTKLRSLKDSGILVTVVTKLRTYTNMALKNLSVPRNAQTGEVLRFTAQFLQIKVVQNKSITLPVELPKTKPVEGRGKQVAKPAERPEAYRSGLKTASDALGVTTPGSGVN